MVQDEKVEQPVAARIRILIVDDEAANMKALCDTLGDHGYDTTGSTNGKLALTTLRQSKFDILLTDLMMPEIDGIALLEAAFQLDPEMIGIIMTGQGTIASAVEAMKLGAFDYILKPFKISVVLPVLARALAMRRLRLENAQLAERVQRRTEELQAANEELEAFAYSVSHDLRTPLRHIQGYGEMLAKAAEGRLSGDAQRYVRIIVDTSEQMDRLIDDLLAFSRIGRVELRKDNVSLDRLMDETIRGLEMATRGRNIFWNVSPLPGVEGDPSLIKQVFANLIGNAIKYSSKRAPSEIEVGCAGREGDRVVLFVRDNGVGFDMQFAGKLFGVFQRLHRAEEFEGTGIGLANARRIVARHGGRIWAEAAPDKGATFYFTLKPSLPE